MDEDGSSEREKPKHRHSATGTGTAHLPGPGRLQSEPAERARTLDPALSKEGPSFGSRAGAGLPRLWGQDPVGW